MSHGSRTTLRLSVLACAAACVVVWIGAAGSPPGDARAQASSACWIVPPAGSPGRRSPIAVAGAAL